jgi:hypothetical protein
MTDRKLRYTLSAAAWVVTLLWSLALLSTATAAATAARAAASVSASSLKKTDTPASLSVDPPANHN